MSDTCLPAGEFSWNELLTTDPARAQTFYAGLFGWTSEAFHGGTDYAFFKKGDRMVGGFMKCPKPGLPAHWLAYVTVENVDAAVTQTSLLGGSVLMPAMDVPTVGRIAVLADPLGAAFGVFQPAKKNQTGAS